MSNISKVKHVLCRDGVYYYVRRVPSDISDHYSRNKLYFSLRTKSYAAAARAAEAVSQKLEAYWMGLRLQQLDIPQLTGAAHLDTQRSNLPSLSDAQGLYIRLKGTGKNKTFRPRSFTRLLAIFSGLSRTGFPLFNQRHSHVGWGWSSVLPLLMF